MITFCKNNLLEQYDRTKIDMHRKDTHKQALIIVFSIMWFLIKIAFVVIMILSISLFVGMIAGLATMPFIPAVAVFMNATELTGMAFLQMLGGGAVIISVAAGGTIMYHKIRKWLDKNDF